MTRAQMAARCAVDDSTTYTLFASAYWHMVVPVHIGKVATWCWCWSEQHKGLWSAAGRKPVVHWCLFCCFCQGSFVLPGVCLSVSNFTWKLMIRSLWKFYPRRCIFLWTRKFPFDFESHAHSGVFWTIVQHRTFWPWWWVCAVWVLSLYMSSFCLSLSLSASHVWLLKILGDLYFSGRQPYRTGLYGPLLVLLPAHGVGLLHEEVTIAEALRDFAGYTTGIVGKWHLGQCHCTVYCALQHVTFSW